MRVSTLVSFVQKKQIEINFHLTHFKDDKIRKMHTFVRNEQGSLFLSKKKYLCCITVALLLNL